MLLLGRLVFNASRSTTPTWLLHPLHFTQKKRQRSVCKTKCLPVPVNFFSCRLKDYYVLIQTQIGCDMHMHDNISIEQEFGQKHGLSSIISIFNSLNLLRGSDTSSQIVEVKNPLHCSTSGNNRARSREKKHFSEVDKVENEPAQLRNLFTHSPSRDLPSPP